MLSNQEMSLPTVSNNNNNGPGVDQQHLQVDYSMHHSVSKVSETHDIIPAEQDQLDEELHQIEGNSQ